MSCTHVNILESSCNLYLWLCVRVDIIKTAQRSHAGVSMCAYTCVHTFMIIKTNNKESNASARVRQRNHIQRSDHKHTHTHSNNAYVKLKMHEEIDQWMFCGFQSKERKKNHIHLTVHSFMRLIECRLWLQTAHKSTATATHTHTHVQQYGLVCHSNWIRRA